MSIPLIYVLLLCIGCAAGSMLLGIELQREGERVTEQFGKRYTMWRNTLRAVREIAKTRPGGRVSNTLYIALIDTIGSPEWLSQLDDDELRWLEVRFIPGMEEEIVRRGLHKRKRKNEEMIDAI